MTGGHASRFRSDPWLKTLSIFVVDAFWAENAEQIDRGHTLVLDVLAKEFTSRV
jgi:hypothetical protein